MKTETVIIMTLDEAKNLLYEWYTDMIVNDRQNVLDHVRGGGIKQICPDLTTFSPDQIAEQIGELNIAEKFARPNTNKIMVQISDYHYVVVWDDVV